MNSMRCIGLYSPFKTLATIQLNMMQHFSAQTKHPRRVDAIQHQKIRCYSLLFISGIISTAADWHVTAWPISLLGFCGLIYGLYQTDELNLSPYMMGLVWGLGYYFSACHWIITPIKTVAHLPIHLALSLSALFMCICAQLPALTLYLAQKLRTWLPLSGALILPWILLEWLCTHSSLTFPWTLIGYLYVQAPWASLAPYGGVFAVGAASLIFCTWLVQLYCSKRKQLIILKLLILITISYVLNGLPLWTQPQSDLKVHWVEGHRSLQEKWQPKKRREALNFFISHSTLTPHPQLLIWPEGALPWIAERAPDQMKHLRRWVQKNHLNLLTGVFHTDNGALYNSALLQQPTQTHFVNKHVLVPFGEYLPFSTWLTPLLKYLSIPLSQLQAGKTLSEIQVNQYPLAMLICYEIAYPNWVWKNNRHTLASVVITDDSWFNSNVAIQEHLNILHMRTLETQKHSVFINDSGMSQIIPLPSDRHQPHTLILRSGQTPVVRWGLLPMALLSLIAVLITLRYRPQNE